jgi:hypothetical protein
MGRTHALGQTGCLAQFAAVKQTNPQTHTEPLAQDASALVRCSPGGKETGQTYQTAAAETTLTLTHTGTQRRQALDASALVGCTLGWRWLKPVEA